MDRPEELSIRGFCPGDSALFRLDKIEISGKIKFENRGE
jgi:hypothetical protein